MLQWRHIAAKRDWQPQHDANCGDEKVEQCSTSSAGQVCSESHQLCLSSRGGLVDNEWETSLLQCQIWCESRHRTRRCRVQIRLGPFCAECACSPCTCVAALHVLQRHVGWVNCRLQIARRCECLFASPGPVIAATGSSPVATLSAG